MKKLLLTLCIILTVSNLFSQTSWASFVLKDTLCEGSSVNVTANTGTVTATGYTWSSSPSGPMITSPNNSVSSITFPSAGSYTISLTATDGTTIDVVSNPIVVLPNPTLSITGPTSPICPPPTAIGGLNMTASGANTYTWMPGSVTGANYSQMQPSGSTTFYITGKDAYGCWDTAQFYVQVLPAPAISVSAPTMVCDQDYVCVQDLAMDLVMWVWNGPCGWTQSFGSTACFTASLGCGGTFTVGGNNTQCMNYTTFSITVSICANIKELSGSNFKIYPNPVMNELNLKLDTEMILDPQLEFSDITGRIIRTEKPVFSSENIGIIKLEELESGIYFVKIISENKTSQPIKIIKE